MLRVLSGASALIFALAAVLVGIFFPARPLLISALSVVALALLIAFSLSYFEAFKVFSRRRSAQIGLNSILMVVFFLFIVIMINLIVGQYYSRADFSATGRFTLSPQTEAIVGGLKEETTVLVFLGGQGSDYRGTLALLEGYRYLNRRLVYSIYDLDAVPAIAQTYGVDKYGTTVVIHGERQIRFEGVDEQSLTNGIIRITREGSKVVYLIEGHGEHGLDVQGRTGIKRAADSLEALGFEVRPLNLQTVTAIPEDASAVVIAGPKSALQEREAAMLKAYAPEGRVMVLADLEGDHLDDFLPAFGLRFIEGLVREPQKMLAGKGETVPVVDTYPNTPVTEGFSLTTVFPTVMGLSDEAGFHKSIDYIPIVRSSDSSIVNIDGERVSRGAVTLGMLISYKEKPGRIIVFGDSDFISNDYIDTSGNGNLFRNAISHLAGETDLVSISPARTEFVPLYITGSQASTVTYVFVVGPPVLIALLGFAAWLRKRGG